MIYELLQIEARKRGSNLAPKPMCRWAFGDDYESQSIPMNFQRYRELHSDRETILDTDSLHSGVKVIFDEYIEYLK